MRIADKLARAVAFIGVKVGGKFVPKATAFFVIYHQDGFGFYHLVTAEHVISGLVSKGHKIYLRLNITDGSAEDFELEASHWTFHPDSAHQPTDVAVCAINVAHRKFDYAAIPLTGKQSHVCTEEVLRNEGIGIGDEVAIIGLFRSHYGVDKNIPVVRIGNLAMMRGEPILTKYCGYIDGYLVEARSIAGLSGSPVFVNMPPTRIVNTAVQTSEKAFYFLGLMHGHFDVRNLNDDVVADEDDNASAGVHTGMGVVIPADKIIETLGHPDLMAARAAHAADLRAKGGATPDLAGEESVPPATADNPSHKEDFTRLLGAAVKTKPQAD